MSEASTTATANGTNIETITETNDQQNVDIDGGSIDPLNIPVVPGIVADSRQVKSDAQDVSRIVMEVEYELTKLQSVQELLLLLAELKAKQVVMTSDNLTN